MEDDKEITAREAGELADLSKSMCFIYKSIRASAKKGETNINLHLNDAQRGKLRSLGFGLQDEIDDDSDYRGTWITWNLPKEIERPFPPDMWGKDSRSHTGLC